MGKNGPDKTRTHMRQAIGLRMAIEKLPDGALGHPLADQAHAEDVPNAKKRNYVFVPQVLPCDGLTTEGLHSTTPIRSARPSVTSVMHTFLTTSTLSM
jgi:hypothetical protein